jgi:hypothetical protein
MELTMPQGWGRSFGRGAWRRYAPPMIALMVILTICFSILQPDAGKLSEPAVGLVRSLVWPSVLILTLLFFRQQAEVLFANLNDLIARVSSFTIANISMQAGPERIPVPKGSDLVTLENVALLHTSFLRRDKTREFNDGLIYYQIEVVVIAPDVTLDRIELVTYHLDESYPKTTYPIDDRQTKFKLKELANGTSIVRAEIKFKDQENPLHLNRFIDLRPEGPKI